MAPAADAEFEHCRAGPDPALEQDLFTGSYLFHLRRNRDDGGIAVGFQVDVRKACFVPSLEFIHDLFDLSVATRGTDRHIYAQTGVGPIGRRARLSWR